VVLFDIDRFKTINDGFGHLAGDQVIRHVAEILRSGIRTTDTLFRYGGDEFLLLLPGTGLDGGRVVASKLLGKIRKTACRFEETEDPVDLERRESRDPRRRGA
jgi:diguanylate cyclase (GGDEF)-like protein